MKKIDDIFNLNNKVIVITGATGLLGKKHAPSPFFRNKEPVVKANVL